MKESGFTLIEFLIYIGLVAIILSATVLFAWVLINDQIKHSNITTIESTGEFILNAIEYHVQRADSLDALTVYGSNPGRLVLNYLSNPWINFETYQKQISQGGQIFPITKLRFHEDGSTQIDMTGDNVVVSNFVIHDRSVGGVIAIEVDLTLDMVNTSGSQVFDATNSWARTVTLRKY